MDPLHKEGSGSVKVLLIPPLLERNYETFFKHFKPEFKKVFTFYIVKPIPRHGNGTVDYSRLLDHCRNLIKAENIGAVFANKQPGALVWAILCEEFTHIRGPSIESVFLCNHEYYKTAVIDSRQHKIPYSLHAFGDDRYDFAFNVMTSVMPPCVIRPCLGMGHSTYEFNNRDQLLKVVNRCKLDTEHIVGMHQYLVKNFIDRKKYPLATAPAVLMSSILGSVFSKVHIEACVFQKELIPWTICDVMIMPQSEQSDSATIFSGVKYPSHLPPDMRDTLWMEFRSDVDNLVKHGLDHTFLHAEYDVYEDGFIHLVALCVGPNANNTKMYTHALTAGNNMEAALQVAMGIRPQQPCSNLDGQVIVNHIMLVYQSGKADSLINFSNALTNPNVWLRYLPAQDIVIEPAKRHAIVGSIVAKGRDTKHCIEQIKTLRNENLKIPDHVPLSL